MGCGCKVMQLQTFQNKVCLQFLHLKKGQWLLLERQDPGVDHFVELAEVVNVSTEAQW